MARSNSNGALKFVGAASAAIIGGIAIGYLFGGAHGSHPIETPVLQQPLPPISTPSVSVASPPLHPHTANGNYTAPGSPRIVIHEESAPVLRRVDRTIPTVPADTEASQEAPPVQVGGPNKTSHSSATDSGAPSSDTSPAPDGSTTDTTTPAINTAPGSGSAPADPDFEHVTKPGDGESGQEGGSKAQFRVQTGSYTDESNARSVADQLRGQGFTTSTHSEREGNHLVFKVQAGAYRSKNGANKAAEDLQKKGFPAYVTQITP